jgi:hypothetical protein
LLYAVIPTVILTGLSYYVRNNTHNEAAISEVGPFLPDVKKLAGVGLSSDANNTREYLGAKSSLPDIRKVWSATLAAVSSTKFLYSEKKGERNVGLSTWKYIDGTDYPGSRAYVRATSWPVSPVASNKFNEVSLGTERFTQEYLTEIPGSILSGILYWVANRQFRSILPLNYSSDNLELPVPTRTNLLVWNWVAIAEKTSLS